jgi:hypothetical protein
MKVDVSGFPEKQGLYDPALEKDACGVGYVASINGVHSHKVWSSRSCNVYISVKLERAWGQS